MRLMWLYKLCRWSDYDMRMDWRWRGKDLPMTMSMTMSMTQRWLDDDLTMTWRWHWPWHDQWYDNTMLAQIKIYSMFSNNTMHKCTNLCLFLIIILSLRQICLGRLKVTSPMVETQLSLKKPKGISKIHMYISHELHPRGGGSNSVFYENYSVFLRQYPKYFWKPYLQTTQRISCNVP